MESNLKNAILQFLGNEFQMDPAAIREDLNFEIDLGLNQAEVADVLQRLQDALDFPAPEEKLTQVHSIEDLFRILGIETESDHLS